MTQPRPAKAGDRKKGDETDYVKRQYIGNLGKIENGIVAVTAYEVIEGIDYNQIQIEDFLFSAA